MQGVAFGPVGPFGGAVDFKGGLAAEESENFSGVALNHLSIILPLFKGGENTQNSLEKKKINSTRNH